MISKKLSLILLALVFVIEAGALFWIRGDYRSTMLDGAEYEVPAAIDFKGDFYGRNYLPIYIPLTEAPWKGSVTPEKGQEIYLSFDKNSEGMMELTGASDRKPGGMYIITRVISASDGLVHFNFPADRMYMLPEQLKKLSVVELSERVQLKDKTGKKTETRMKNDLTALVHIKDGRVVISRVLANGSPVEQTYTTVGKNLSVKYARSGKEKDAYSVGRDSESKEWRETYVYYFDASRGSGSPDGGYGKQGKEPYA